MIKTEFNCAVLFFGCTIFFIIPLYYFIHGIVLPITTIFLSFGLGIAFGFFATREFMKIDEAREKGKSHISKKDLKMRCPLCKNKLVELYSDIDKVVYNSYNGLIYCVNCDFEEEKPNFEKRFPNYE